ncbi:hypothetical protein [Phaeodactylibacter xiamenensis]|uniref:hypothetical protein n=1 Tax=Phaeodactylibacter xiamenensis TaxID=1524460 RepID=UPI003BADB337
MDGKIRNWVEKNNVGSSPVALTISIGIAHRVNAPAMAWLGFLAGRSPFARRADYGKTKSTPGECPGSGLD